MTFVKGHKPWNAGKKASDYPKLQAALDKAHEASKQKGAWNKGLTKETDERVAAMSKPHDEIWNKHISDGHKNSTALHDYLINRSDEEKNRQLNKSWLTKKLNNTTNTSSQEEKLYKQLLIENEGKTIYRNYKCDRYPFYCDFYIVEDDLFIELNASWTHGGKPFDENDLECQDKLKEWQLKAETSQYYKNAIETWTIRDVKKQKVAKENKLNYKVIY